ncbi:hypothetical protein NVP1102O_10 [Vibrio phage 1.102.O._10N.261.45.E3]|uniref:Uncharacterized protein n=9 Tax=Autolykiviridae TaxID=2184034 RepID=A0A2I7R1Y7_9VIRU|nr:hypothetical protein KMD64_gp09 [Vibrio phage 1.044.O._10N.261.51.B8]AUR83892.1 hypothetical protein NVP1043O_09 [Vibrio phage 1.043.O._10N.261.52.C7]AUR84097.1 hypothetical protein NVP1048O_10 [Vibrio phage 1.048.O._10N.286.46.A10]AUR84504.1 hypothetical protein NVP1057O_09 [Vibrio phage 1.057.O._10N.261.46.B12]AUR87134.1 hypothetical protein NVP1095O_10 [Vibrio phage 1.095.O._10N.286.46.E10]AUR87645.1 hypothetical protein NVP1102O_10 [Vibrio phage 1.102.O._10N.261.45.E3]AUR88010.1 hypoth
MISLPLRFIGYLVTALLVETTISKTVIKKESLPDKEKKPNDSNENKKPSNDGSDEKLAEVEDKGNGASDDESDSE